MKQYAVFDIGGSSIKHARIDSEARILTKGKCEVPSRWDEFLDTLVRVINQYKDQTEISGVAVSAPGAVDFSTGIIGGSSAIPYIHGPNFKEILYNWTHLPVEIENDANCAALAEVWQGVAKDANNVAFFICGTGVGGCVIKDRRVHHGAHLHGGEFGYCVLDIIDGKPKTLSDLGATGALVKKIAKRKQENEKDWDGLRVFEQAGLGDPVCQEEINNFFYYLAVGVYNVQYIYDPEMIIMGGAISERNDLLDCLNQKLDEILSSLPAAKVRPNVVRCNFKNDANLLGALYHYLHMGHSS